MKSKSLTSLWSSLAALTLSCSFSAFAGNITWNTAGPDNNWNTTTANWTGDASVFTTGDNVTFDAATGETITVATGGVAPATTTVGANNGAWTFAGAAISGALTKAGTGTLTLSAANSFSSVALNGGSLTITNIGALGTGTLTVGSGATGPTTAPSSGTPGNFLYLSGLTSAQTFARAIALPIDASKTFRKITVQGSTSTSYGANSYNFSGLISGGGAGSILYFDSATAGDAYSVIRLSNASNSFTGTVQFNRASLQLDSDAVLGASTNKLIADAFGSSRLIFNFAGNFTHPIDVMTGTNFQTNANNITTTDVINGGAAITKIGTGTLTIGGLGVNTHSGLVTVSEGTLKLAKASALGTTAAGTTVNAGGVLDLNGQTIGAEALTLNGTGLSSTGALVNSSATAASFAGNVTLASNASIGGVGATTLTGNLLGAFTFTKVGAGDLTLSGASTVAGSTVRANTGWLKLSGSLVPLGSFVVASGASLDVASLTTPLSIATGATLTAGRSGTAATDITGPFSTGVGTLRVMEGTGIGTLTTNGNVTFNGGNVNFDLTNNAAGTNDQIVVGGTLNLTAPTTINLNLTNGSLGNGSYVLAKANAVSGSVSNISVVGLPAVGSARQTFVISDTTVANAVTLDVIGTVASLVWTGASNANWSTDAADENWNNLTAADSQDRFYHSDSVTFADLAAPGPVTVGVIGTVMPSQIVVNNSAAGTAYTLDCSASVISGATGLLKQGSGTLNIIGLNNHFSGGVQINGGTVEVETLTNAGVVSSLGSGATLSFDGGALSDYDIINNASDRALTIGAGGATIGMVDPLLSLTLSGALTGNGNLTISGAGRVVMSGAGSRAGTTTIQSPATLEISGAAVPGAGAFTLNGKLVMNGTAAATIAQAISGSGSLVKQGTPALTLSAANSYAGGTTLNGGNLVLGNASALGSGTLTVGAGASTGTADTATFTTTAISGNVVISNGIVLPADAVANTNRAFYMYGVGNANNTVEFAGKITGGSTNTRLYLNNNQSGSINPQFVFSNSNNDFKGNIWINRGGIQIASNEALGYSANTVTFDSNGGADMTFLSAMTYTHDTTLLTDTDFDTKDKEVTASGVISGAVGLNKIGTGTLILSGVSSAYTGAINVNAGTLKVKSAGVIGTGVNAVSVAATATIGGSGTINRPVIVTGNIAPGETVGPLTTGATTINGSYLCDVEGTNSDQIIATNLTLGAASTLTVADRAGVFPRVIATYSGTLSGTFAHVTTGYQVDYSTPNQIILNHVGGYTTWASNHAGGGQPDGDADGDGVPNALEYFMGETVDTFTANPSVVDGKVRWAKDATVTDASYVVQVSTDLQTWVPAPSGVEDLGTSVQYTPPTGETKTFVRLSVTITQ